MEFSLLIHIFWIDRNCSHLCQKHIMGTKLNDLFYFAFNADRTLCNSRCRDGFGLTWSQMHLFEFVYLSAGFDTTIIGSKRQIVSCQIDHKLAGFFDNIIRITLFSHGNRHHCRIRADGSCPCHGNNVRSLLRTLAADHNCRYRIQHISRFPKFSFHITLLFFSNVLSISFPDLLKSSEKSLSKCFTDPALQT